MTPKQRTRLESMILWYTERAVDSKGTKAEHHHLAKAQCLRILLKELERPCASCGQPR